ncbi:MAG: thiamine biosynthesis lipoprotein [Planctomycetota bacterium]
MIARFAATAMATRFEFVLEGGDESRLRAVCEEAFEELKACDARWSAFTKDSVVSRINREAFAGPVRVDAETCFLLEEALRISTMSCGYFDPTIAPLMRRFGHRGNPTAVGETEDSWGCSQVLLDETARTVSFQRAGIAIDLGGVAKGRALDLAAEVLRDGGIECALLHGGTSSVLALDPPPGEEFWRVAVGKEDEQPIAQLANSALSVSSTAGRVSEAGSHVIDPLSGEPCSVSSSVAVIASCASTADAWSTAFCAAGKAALDPAPDLQVLQSLPNSNRWLLRSLSARSFQFSPEEVSSL